MFQGGLEKLDDDDANANADVDLVVIHATSFETYLKEFETRLEEWESIQSKILTWFINTFVATINSLFPCLGTAKPAQDFLANHYNCTNDSTLEFHIESKFYRLCQELDQSISNYYTQTSSIWKQLVVVNP